MNITPWRRRDSRLPATFDFDDILNNFWGNGRGTLASRLPEVFTKHPFTAVNLAESDKEFTITMDCPGLKESDITVESIGNQLVLSGERKWEEEEEGKEFKRVESQFGKFERTISLPDTANLTPEVISAHYDKGVLMVKVPKRVKTPTAKIPVKTGAK